MQLKRLRENKGLTQAQLGKLLNVSSSTIGMYEQNRRFPDEKTLKSIANFFNVSIDYLLELTDIPDRTNKQTALLTTIDTRCNSHEKELIKMYRELPDSTKTVIDTTIKASYDQLQAEKKNKRGNA